MKYIKKIIALFLIFQSCLLYGEIDFDKINSIFLEANKLYEEGNFLEANNLYKNIASSNIISKDLYFNIASSYGELGSNGHAILWYERALNISPFDKEIKNNIELFNPNSSLNPIKNKSNLIIIFYLTLFLFILFFTILIILFIKKRKIYYSLIILSVLFIVPALISYNLINADYLIVVSRTNLYRGESERTEIISVIGEGEKFRILEEYSNWYHVKGSFKGWINKSFAEKI
mgnify:FL=1